MIKASHVFSAYECCCLNDDLQSHWSHLYLIPSCLDCMFVSRISFPAALLQSWSQLDRILSCLDCLGISVNLWMLLCSHNGHNYTSVHHVFIVCASWLVGFVLLCSHNGQLYYHAFTVCASWLVGLVSLCSQNDNKLWLISFLLGLNLHFSQWYQDEDEEKTILTPSGTIWASPPTEMAAP